MKKTLYLLYQGQQALLLLVLLGFIWGSGYSLAKYAMINSVPPLAYAFWQSLGPALLLTILCLWKQKKALFKPAYWPYYFMCGLLGITIPNTNMYFVANHIPAGLLAVLVNTVPLLVYPLALMFKLEQFDLRRIIAVALGMLGILLILSPTSTGLVSYWALITLISPLSFACCSIYIGIYQPKTIDALPAACGMLITATLILIPILIKQHTFYSLMPPFTLPKQAILLEILLSSLGYILFFKLIHVAGPVFYSLTGGVVALTGLWWGFFIFQEIPNQIQCIAALSIILAIFLLSWCQSQQKRYPLAYEA
ncbi:ABC transporter, transmembrane permease,permeases of drug/metabolite transporter type [Legionella beliardensis]|uniref:ABC transporter, transmembrane permease,permeases of drug/metabolite transporter type n=1 Tax=Legionella beliardensis TaxID=91822 RepID=A0A378I358_9GAMM|nr:DMT family transporter [Legionella beliardensis]STX29609.1 ABC transporter, transmembrane permease,permeases of drug/metabolite transporter type [Legionella beliardensis]